MEHELFPDLVVNGGIVPQTAIAAEAQNHAAPKGNPGVVGLRAARALAIRTLLLQEARGRGFDGTSGELTPGRFETAEEALIRGVLEADQAATRPTPDDVQAQRARDLD